VLRNCFLWAIRSGKDNPRREGKTGYKIHERYRDCGVEGLTDRSRRPYRHANQLPFQIETLIVRLKREKPVRFYRLAGYWRKVS